MHFATDFVGSDGDADPRSLFCFRFRHNLSEVISVDQQILRHCVCESCPVRLIASVLQSDQADEEITLKSLINRRGHINC